MKRSYLGIFIIIKFPHLIFKEYRHLLLPTKKRLITPGKRRFEVEEIYLTSLMNPSTVKSLSADSFLRLLTTAK